MMDDPVHQQLKGEPALAAQKWKQRAVKAEQLLETISSRVGEVRAAYSNKIEELEAEKKEIQDSYEDSRAQIAKLEAALAERDNTITRLCKEVAEEKRVRQAESEAVGERAEQIRTWVNVKVAQLEEENRRLQDELDEMHKYDEAEPFHDYEEPPPISFPSATSEYDDDSHDYEEPTDAFKKRFKSPTQDSEAKPVPPRRSSRNKPPPKRPPKHIVPSIAPLPAPEFKATELGRPARPPTPDLSLLTPGSSPIPMAKSKFLFSEHLVRQQHHQGMMKSRSESDLLADDNGRSLSPLMHSKRKLSEPEISQKALPVMGRKPRPVPRRCAREFIAARKCSSPATLEEAQLKRPDVQPRRRRAVTDGDLDLMAEEESRRPRPVLHDSNPYERLAIVANLGNTALQSSPPVPMRTRKRNQYYQLETPENDGFGKPNSNPMPFEAPEIRSRSPVCFASQSSDASTPPSPGFLQPLSAFTSVNTLPRAADSWAKDAAATDADKHDYSNIDVLPTINVEADGHSHQDTVIISDHVSSSDSALGTLDKDKIEVHRGPPSSPSLAESSEPSLVLPPPPVPVKPSRKPPVPPPIPRKKNSRPMSPASPPPMPITAVSVPVMSSVLDDGEANEAPFFETVKRGNSVSVRPTQRKAVTTVVKRYENDNNFLASSDDEKEDRRQGVIPGDDGTSYENSVFKNSVLSHSTPTQGILEDAKANAKRNRIHDLARQHKLHKSFHDNAFADPMVPGSPPKSRCRTQAQKLKLRCDGSVDHPELEKSDLEHQGYLTKQDSKGKAWKRRWFVLLDGELVYYKLKEDQGKRKPQGRLPLDQLLGVSHDQDLALQITTTSRVYSLTADTSVDADAWLTVLQNVLRQSVHKSMPPLAPALLQPECQGWVTRIQEGRAKRCWAALIRRNLYFYQKQASSEAPFADICLERCSLAVGSNTHGDDAALLHSGAAVPAPPVKFTITLFADNEDTNLKSTSLTVSGKEEKDQWLYHLTVACKGFDETDTEHLVSMLKDNQHERMTDFEGDNKVWWKHPVLSYSKKFITQPLTTLPTEELRQKAVDIFKHVQMFCEVKVEQRGIEYHVAHVQTLLEDVSSHPGLCDELYCQLIRQSSNHPDPTGIEVMQCWRLLVIFMACDLPRSEKFNWYLQRHIQRHLDYSGSVAVLAATSQRLLKRVNENGPRSLLPSRLEIHCLLLGDLSLTRPIMLPVELMDGNRYAVECDAVSSVHEVTDRLSQRLGLRDTLWSGFALFASQPLSTMDEEYLDPNAKICDAVRHVEKLALSDHRNGRLAPEKLWRLTFKNRLYFKGLSNQETDTEKRLLLFQIHRDVVSGVFPVNEEFSVDLMAHAMQVAQGPCPAGLNSHQRQGALNYGVNNYFPKKMLKSYSKAEIQALTQRLWVKWDGLRQKTKDQCLGLYLRMVRRWPYCSASFYPCSTRGLSAVPLLMAVQEDCISFLHRDTLDLDRSYRYNQLLTFGGYEGDLMLVIEHAGRKISSPRSAGGPVDTLDRGGLHKVLLQMKPPDVTAATLCIASYIKHKEKQQIALEEAATALGL